MRVGILPIMNARGRRVQRPRGRCEPGGAAWLPDCMDMHQAARAAMAIVPTATRLGAPARRRRLALRGIAALPWFAQVARAAGDANYPNRAIRLILPSAIGGSGDLVARLVAPPLGEALGQPVVIESRPGAAGRIAVEYVAGTAPDGYTLLLANNGADAIVPAKHEGAGVPSEVRFAPVAMLARMPVVVVVSPALGVDALDGLIERARRASGRLFYASGGVGSTSHMAAVLLFGRAGVRLGHVPYAGTSMAVKDVLAGEVPVLFTYLGTVATLIRAGRLQALAVTGSHRMDAFPQVPTVAEEGYPDFDVTTWQGIVVPEGTPRPVVARLHDALLPIIALPRVRSQLAALGMEPVGGSSSDFAQAIRAAVRQWEEVARITDGPRR